MPIQIVRLGQSEFFQQKKNLDSLNALLEVHDTWTPYMLMRATGCSFDDALYILIRLFDLYLADGYLLVYNRNDPDGAIDRRKFEDGYPPVPYVYEDEDQEYEIEDPNDFLYRFEFGLLSQDIRFESYQNDE